jgi:hypothetical protein
MSEPRYVQAPGAVHREVEGEVLVVPALEQVLDLDDVFFLLGDPVSVRVWQLLGAEGGQSLEELVGAITGEFEVADEAARGDLERFLGELQAAGAAVELA